MASRRQTIAGGAALATLPLPASHLALSADDPIIHRIATCRQIALAWGQDSSLWDEAHDKQPIWDGYVRRFRAADDLVRISPIQTRQGAAAALRYAFHELLEEGADDGFERRVLLRAIAFLEAE